MKTKGINQVEWKEIEFLNCLEKEASNNKLKIQGKDFLEEGKYPVIDQGEGFIAGYTNDKSKVYSGKFPVVVFGDHTRIFKFVNFPFALGADGVKILVPKEDIDAKYFYYSLRKLYFPTAGYSRHYKFLKGKKIPLPFTPDGKPDLETQKKIVAILEKAEQLKEKRKKTLELLDEYLKSVFSEMFLKDTRKKISLSQLTEINPKKSELGDLSEDTKITFLGMEDIGENGEIFNRRFKKLNEVIKSYTYFQRNDVLFAKITPCMENGKGAIAEIPTKIGFGSTEFHVIRPIKNKTTSEWVYYLLHLDSIRRGARNNMTGSAGQKRVPKSFFDKLKIPIPPLSLQQKFATIVSKVEILKEKQNKSYEEMNNLFGALMQKAFKGELTI